MTSIGIGLMQAAAPLPHVPDHIGHAIGAVTCRGILTDGRRFSDAALVAVTLARIPLISPRPLIAIFATRGFLPLSLGRQAHNFIRLQLGALPHFLSEPL